MRVGTHKHGFTIVELLIVVVVIAILAAITIVAFNGIQERSRASAAQAVAKQAYTSIASFAVQNDDTYPANLAAAGLTNSGDTTYQYQVNNSANPRTFCVTATKQNVSYYVSQSASAPVAGGCAGHVVNGLPLITNLVANPSFEGGWSPGWVLEGGVSAGVESTVGVTNGSNSLRLTKTTNGTPENAAYANINLQAGVTYTLSYTVVQAAGGGNYTVGLRDANGSTYILGGSGGGPFSVVPSSPTRVTVSGTALTTGAGRMFIRTGSGTIGDSIAIDSMILTEGDAVPNYYDGNSPGWTWSGTPGRSNSSGSPF